MPAFHRALVALALAHVALARQTSAVPSSTQVPVSHLRRPAEKAATTAALPNIGEYADTDNDFLVFAPEASEKDRIDKDKKMEAQIDKEEGELFGLAYARATKEEGEQATVISHKEDAPSGFHQGSWVDDALLEGPQKEDVADEEYDKEAAQELKKMDAEQQAQLSKQQAEKAERGEPSPDDLEAEMMEGDAEEPTGRNYSADAARSVVKQGIEELRWLDRTGVSKKRQISKFQTNIEAYDEAHDLLQSATDDLAGAAELASAAEQADDKATGQDAEKSYEAAYREAEAAHKDIERLADSSAESVVFGL